MVHLRSKPKLASDESIEFWTWRKNLELKAIDKLPIKSYIIDNSNYDWDSVFEKIVAALIL